MKYKVFSIIGLSLLLLLFIIPNQAESAGENCYQSTPTSKTYINVSVANLWKEPGIKRTIDKYSLSNPVDMNIWTKKMSTFDSRQWLVGNTETEGLYGQEVKVLKVSGKWAYIAIKDQTTPKNKYGYPGWLPKYQIITQKNGYSKCPVASVNAKKAYLYTNKNEKFLEISFNTRLPILQEEKNWIEVMTPSNQEKWIKRKDIQIFSSLSQIPKPKGEDIVQTGKRFKGLRYLWAGNSAYGFDCSGFTHSIYKHYGILIPRDAADQFKKGTFVPKGKLQPGDLMFFAYDKGNGKVHHVAMYAGKGQMIHSPRPGKTIEIISIHTKSYAQEYAGARRYIK